MVISNHPQFGYLVGKNICEAYIFSHTCSSVQWFNNFSGKPSKPKGPLEVSAVTANGCKLQWKKPEDDGGTPIDHYVVERMDTESGRWVPCAETKTPEAEVSDIFIYFLLV